MSFTARIFIGLGILLTTCVSSAWSQDYKGKDEFEFVQFCRRIKGRIIDHTGNHGQDHRIWSRSLHQWRDLYVYLPPGYTPKVQYPFMLYLHPFCMDERTFLSVVPLIDDAIASGKLPPLIIAAPDGSMDGRGHIHKPGSMFLNSRSGPYEDFILADVWDFVTQRYPIRPEREAHILAGASMGGFAAFNIGLRHRNAFGIVIGIHPALNLRWSDVNGNPRAKFDPRKWGWRTGFDSPNEVIANYYNVAKIRMGELVEPVFGIGDEAMVNIVCNNPLELAIRTGLRNGELSMFIGYAGRDEFNIDAQVESFLYYAKHRGWGVAVAFEPDGRHDGATALKFVPSIIKWLAPQLQFYAPPLTIPDPKGPSIYPETKNMPTPPPGPQKPAIYPDTRTNGNVSHSPYRLVPPLFGTKTAPSQVSPFLPAETSAEPAYPQPEARKRIGFPSNSILSPAGGQPANGSVYPQPGSGKATGFQVNPIFAPAETQPTSEASYPQPRTAPTLPAPYIAPPAAYLPASR